MEPSVETGAIVAAAALLANQIIEIVKVLWLNKVQDETVRKPTTILVSAGISLGVATLFAYGHEWLQVLPETVRLVLLAAWPVAWGMHQANTLTHPKPLVVEGEVLETTGQ